MKKKLSIFAALAAATALSSSSAIAMEMEKCKIVDANGKGLIKAHKGDCAGGGHSCAGYNAAGDAEAWILVPSGQCDKINKGDLSGVSDTIKDKIEVEGLPKAEAMAPTKNSAELHSRAKMSEPEDAAVRPEPEDSAKNAHTHDHSHSHSHSH